MKYLPLDAKQHKSSKYIYLYIFRYNVHCHFHQRDYRLHIQGNEMSTEDEDQCQWNA